MTKREFDEKTKINGGGRLGSWVDRGIYRARRMKSDTRAPLLERRAAYLAARGMSPLWIGSPLRAPALFSAGMWGQG